MSAHDQPEPERIEAALKSLAPAPPALDRDRLMFRAGRAARGRTAWRVSVLTALVGIVAGTAGTFLGMRTAPLPEPRIQYVYVPAPAPVAPAPPAATQAKESPSTPPAQGKDLVALPAWDVFGIFGAPSGSYVQKRDHMLRWGAETLPPVIPAGSEQQPPGPTNLLKLQAELIQNAAGF